MHAQRTTKISFILLISAGLLAGTGCRNEDQATTSAAPPVAQPSAIHPIVASSFQGVYQGTVIGINNLPINTTLTLSQSGDSVAGTYATPSGQGNLIGNVTGNRLNFTVTPPNGVRCVSQLTGTGTLNDNSLTLAGTIVGIPPATSTTPSGAALGTTPGNFSTPVPPPSAGTTLPNGTDLSCAGILNGQGTLTRISDSSSNQIFRTP